MIHVVPETLTAKLLGTDAHEAPKRSCLEPICKTSLTAWGETAIEDGNEQIGSHTGAVAGFGSMTVDVLKQAQALYQIEERNNRTELGDDNLFGSRHIRRRFPAHGSDDIVCPPEVFLPDDLGLAVDPLAFAGVVVSLAVNVLFNDCCHALGHT